MTLRDKIMDKYWLEFLTAEHDDLYSTYGRRLDSTFWVWFYNEKVSKLTAPLEDFLK